VQHLHLKTFAFGREVRRGRASLCCHTPRWIIHRHSQNTSVANEAALESPDCHWHLQVECSLLQCSAITFNLKLPTGFKMGLAPAGVYHVGGTGDAIEADAEDAVPTPASRFLHIGPTWLNRVQRASLAVSDDSKSKRCQCASWWPPPLSRWRRLRCCHTLTNRRLHHTAWQLAGQWNGSHWQPGRCNIDTGTDGASALLDAMPGDEAHAFYSSSVKGRALARALVLACRQHAGWASLTPLRPPELLPQAVPNPRSEAVKLPLHRASRLLSATEGLYSGTHRTCSLIFAKPRCWCIRSLIGGGCSSFARLPARRCSHSPPGGLCR